jgi:hypothetical protein
VGAEVPDHLRQVSHFAACEPSGGRSAAGEVRRAEFFRKGGPDLHCVAQRSSEPGTDRGMVGGAPIQTTGPR